MWDCRERSWAPMEWRHARGVCCSSGDSTTRSSSSVSASCDHQRYSQRKQGPETLRYIARMRGARPVDSRACLQLGFGREALERWTFRILHSLVDQFLVDWKHSIETSALSCAGYAATALATELQWERRTLWTAGLAGESSLSPPCASLSWLDTPELVAL